MRIKSVLVAVLITALPVAAFADVSDGPMNRCINSSTHAVCVNSFNYYLNKMHHVDPGSEDMCHVLVDSAKVGMADYVLTQDEDDATGSHQILDVVVKNCPDPYLTQARYLRGKLNSYLDSNGGN